VLLTGVGFRYHRRGPWVLDDVTAEVGPGSVVVLEGRNGVGKSTLLQLIVGVLRPSRGGITDRPSRIAWVPERFPADQPFTVAGYLHGVAGLRGLTGPAATAAVDRWTERLGIAGFAATRLPDLSKGTAQKVGLAQALLVPPELLVLDEPWEGLDAASRSLVPTLIAEVLADGGAAIVSDHRGEAGRLPGAATWRLTDEGFTSVAAVAGEMCTVEVALSAAAVPAAVALLRAAGHHQVTVRAAS
jgi:ABC-type multidrug transport system ATPase subunit